jgi:hypothetical protein
MMQVSNSTVLVCAVYSVVIEFLYVVPIFSLSQSHCSKNSRFQHFNGALPRIHFNLNSNRQSPLFINMTGQSANERGGCRIFLHLFHDD